MTRTKADLGNHPEPDGLLALVEVFVSDREGLTKNEISISISIRRGGEE
jgi:hypothetical protein